jgi:acetolactate synthase-1/2/3 large subunit
VIGAHALLRSLVASGVDTCFANPGTSEMHFVAALDGVPEMRAVLTLFEGVATGAADGYARMAERPTATLLHRAASTVRVLATGMWLARTYGSLIVMPVIGVPGGKSLTCS